MQPPETAPSGEVFSSAPVVELLDAKGEVVERRGVGITVEIAAGGGSIVGTALVRTGADGLAVFQDLGIAGLVGPRTLRFSSPGVSAVLSNPIQVVPGPARTVEAYAGNNQTASAGADLPIPPAVRITDQSGNPVAGTAVIFEVTAGNGTLEGATQVSGVDGIARATRWILGTIPGVYVATVTIPGLQGSPVVFTATATVGPPSVITLLEGDGQSAVAGTPVGISPAVKVTDAAGNVVTGIRVNFTVASGGGLVVNGGPITDAEGIARVGAWVLGSDPGPNTLSVTVGSAAPIIFSATGTPVPVTIIFGDGQLGFVGDTLNGFIVVQVVAGGGIPRPDVTVTFEVLSGGGSVDPISVVTDAAGLASTRWVLGNQEGEQTLRASAPGSAPAEFRATAVAFKQVSAGSLSACGLSTAGAAFCWGSGAFGQLGNGASGPRFNPVPVAGGLVFDRLSSNVFANFHCGLTAAGTGYCWGSSRHGQLGNDGIPIGNTSISDVPVPVSGGLTWTQLSPGGDHACGLIADGTAYCWGSNFNGQLGLGGQTGDQNSPRLVTGGLKFLWIAAAYRHTCGITVSKAVYCWGRPDGFKLTGGDLFSPTPVPLPPGVEFAQIVGGEVSTCALTPTGQAYCWGGNGNGQVGDGTTTNRAAPVPVAGGHTFLSLDGRGRTVCGLATDGSTYCWGENSGGQTGTDTRDPPITGTLVDVLLPTPVFGDPDFTMVTAGAFVGCALAGGVAWCWGPNSIGQVGDGTTEVRPIPTKVRFP